MDYVVAFVLHSPASLSTEQSLGLDRVYIVWRIPILQEEASRVQAEAVCTGSLRALSLSPLTFQPSVLNTYKRAAGMKVNRKEQLLEFCFPHQPPQHLFGGQRHGLGSRSYSLQ